MAGSFKATTYGYNLEFSSDNLTIVNTQSLYKCGCPTGWTYVNGTCTLCSTIGLDCPCPEGWTWKNGSCVTCQSVGLSHCFRCDVTKNSSGVVTYEWCDRCVPGYSITPSWTWKTSYCVNCY